MEVKIAKFFISLPFALMLIAILVFNTWNTINTSKILNSKQKKYLVIWIIVWIFGISNMLLNIFTNNNLFLTMFALIFPLSGLMMVIKPKEFSNLWEAFSSQKPVNYIYAKPIIYTPFFVRMMGVGFIILGSLFLISSL